MRRLIPSIVLVTALAGCGSTGSAALPYRPDQPSAPAVSAGYTLLSDRLRVEIDTVGRRLEDAQILKSDGTEVRPQTVEYTSRGGGGGSPIGIGIGVGGGSWGSSGGVGTGVSVGGVLGSGDSSSTGNTFAYFALDQVGQPPWRLRVKMVGVEAAEIVLGESQGAAKPGSR